MSEIININLGYFGLKAGQYFWNQIEEEHKIYKPCNGQSMRGNIHSYFDETQKGRYHNRAIFINSGTSYEHQSIDKLILHNQKTQHFYSQNLLKINSISNQTIGILDIMTNEIDVEIQDCLRSTVQRCDSSPGFHISSDSTSGISIELKCHLMLSIDNLSHTSIIQNFIKMPNLHGNYNINEIYNCGFEISNLYNQSNQINILFDTMSIASILEKQHQYYYKDSSQKYIGKAMAQITSPYRFAGVINTSQRKKAVNLIPIPSMKFICPSISQSLLKNVYSCPLVSALQPNNYLMTNFYSEGPQDKILTMHSHTKDYFAYEEQITTTIRNSFKKNNIHFTKYLTDHIHLSIGQLQQNQNASSCTLVNSRHMGKKIRKLADIFNKSYKRKAFMHQYIENGIEEYMFANSYQAFIDISEDYKPNNWQSEEEEQIDVEEQQPL